MALTVISTLIIKNKVIAAGLQGELVYQNKRVEQVGGYVAINSMWEQMLHTFDLSFIPLQRSDWQYIKTVYLITRAGALGFLLEDPTDMQAATTTADSSTSGVVTALGSNQYQLHKRYTETASTLYSDRKITRPRTDGFVLMISGTPTGSYTMDTTTGIVTIPAGPTAANVTWTGKFYVPVHFMSDTINWDMVKGGNDPDARYTAGQAVVLKEIRE